MTSTDNILPLLLIAIIIVFIAREYLTYKNNLTAKYYLTPMITLLICSVVVLSVSELGFSAYRGLIITSLLCALVADTMLMVIEVDLLRFGLVYFLLGHIFYIAAFSLDYFAKTWNIIAAIIIILILALYFNVLRKKTGKMTIPVFMYFIIISFILFFTVTGLNYWFDRTKLAVMAGGILFVLSDAVLAYNAFIKKIPHSTVITWSMYGPAQLLFALSCFN